MYTDFDELKQKMITPLNNIDFYSLLLLNTEWRRGFTACTNKIYGVNDDGYEKYECRINLLKIAINLNIDAVSKMTETEFKEKYKQNIDKETYINYMTKKLNDIPKLIEDNNIFLTNNLGIDFYSQWLYFRSYRLNPNIAEEEIREKNVKHRLYLTIDRKQRSLFVEKFTKVLSERKMPYFFKVNPLHSQSDSVVIYLSTQEQVVDNVNIINQIIDTTPELAAHLHKPSPHLGIINNRIGYGFEPAKEKGSYSQFILEISKIAHKRFYQKLMRSLLTPIGRFAIIANYADYSQNKDEKKYLEYAINNFCNVENILNQPLPSLEIIQESLKDDKLIMTKAVATICAHYGITQFKKDLYEEFIQVIEEKYPNVFERYDDSEWDYGNNYNNRIKDICFSLDSDIEETIKRKK